jgi:hypothetical protein
MEWKSTLIWTILSLLHVLFWKYLGETYGIDHPPPLECPIVVSPIIPAAAGPLQFNYTYCSLYPPIKLQLPRPEQKYLAVNYSLTYSQTHPERFENFKGEELAKIKSPSPIIIVSKPKDKCVTYAELIGSAKSSVKSCVGIAWSESQQNTEYLQRFNIDAKKTGRLLHQTTPKTSGMFRHVAKKKGRTALSDKFSPLLKHLDDIETLWVKLLEARGIFPGDDIIVMVVNDGEFDLYLNWACSCRAHGISLHNAVVVTASA